MKKLFYLSLLPLLFTLSLQAQDLMLFPESTPNTLSDISIDACLHKSSVIIDSVEIPDDLTSKELEELGAHLLLQGQREYAKDVFEKLLEIADKKYGKEDIHYVRALIDLARVYILLVRYSETITLYQEALVALEKIKGKDSWEYVITLNEAVVAQTRISDFKNSKRLCQENLEIMERLGKRDDISYVVPLNNMGAIKKSLGDIPGAIADYQEATLLAKGHLEHETRLAANLGEAYALAGRTAEAEALLGKYVPVAKKHFSDNNLYHSRLWMQFGLAYIMLGNKTQAEFCLKNALTTNSLTYNVVENIPLQANDLMFKNDYLAVCGQAGTMLYVMYMYKVAYEITGDIEALKEGYEVAKAMVEFGEELQRSYSSEEDKLILFRLGATILFDLSTYYSYELYKNTKDRKYAEDGFFYSERSKSTILLQALLSKEKTYGNLPEELDLREKDLRMQLRQSQKKYIETALPEEKMAVLQEINEKKREIEQFKSKLQRDYPAYYDHHYDDQLATLKDVQAYLESKKETALIEYALGSQYSYAFIVSPKKIEMVDLKIDQADFNQHCSDLRRVLSDYTFLTGAEDAADSMFQESSSYFHQAFVQPLLDKIDGETIKQLIIVPDQNLGHLPFEVFLTDKPATAKKYADYPYLLKKYAISYSFSTSLLIEQIHQQTEREKGPKGVLAFAADYGVAQNEVDLSSRRGVNIAALRKHLQPLPGAQKEVRMMQGHLQGEFYQGAIANEETFKQQAQNYEVIHLAMHGLLNSNNPILSSLAFSENSETDEDNFLHAFEISQLELQAKLVVLSACETGYGKFRQGEGVMSLAHSFMYAGASSVLVSLWQVNDYSTGLIMKDFYDNLSKGQNKDEALRQAKLQYMEQAETNKSKHPAYWAAFVQMGDTGELVLQKKSNGRYLWIFGGLGALVLGFGFLGFRNRKTVGQN